MPIAPDKLTRFRHLRRHGASLEAAAHKADFNGVAGNRDEGCEKDLTRRRRGDRVDGEVIRMLVFEVYDFEVDADSCAKLNLEKAGGRVHWLKTSKGTAIVFHTESKYNYPTETKPDERPIHVFIGPSEKWVTDLVSVGGDPEKMCRHVLQRVS